MNQSETNFSKEQIRMVHDLALHAADRCHTAVSDAAALVDEKELAYSIVLHVIGSLVCSAALLGESKNHSTNIARTLMHLVELMRDHKDHGRSSDSRPS